MVFWICFFFQLKTSSKIFNVVYVPYDAKASFYQVEICKYTSTERLLRCSMGIDLAKSPPEPLLSLMKKILFYEC